MKRVLFVAMNLNCGGAERQMVILSSLLKERGYDVSFVCYSEGDFFADELENIGISVEYILKRKPIERILAFRRYIRNGGYDVVISFLGTANILNCLAALGCRSWKVITGERSLKKDNIRSFQEKISVKLNTWFSDAHVCNSVNAARVLKKNAPKLANRLRVIYNTVRINQKINVEQINHDYVEIVVAASYGMEKNLRSLIDAISFMDDQQRDKLRISWYGSHNFSGSTYAESMAIIEKLGLTRVIGLNPQTKDIHMHMLRADFVGLFSLYEGLPNAICEAMSLGKPIIMTPVSDYDKLLNGNGFLSQGDDAESISYVLRQAIASSFEDRKFMGVKSKELANQMFATSVFINNWIDIIES